MSYLFVYGTLQPGGYFYDRIAHLVEPIGRGFTIGDLYDTGSYPAARFHPRGTGTMYGTILKVHEGSENEVLSIMDYIEGAPYFYKRIQVNVTLDDAQWLTEYYCYAYEIVNLPKRVRLIPSGVWRQQ